MMNKKRFLAVMSAACMALSAISPVMAATNTNTEVVSEGAFDIRLRGDEIKKSGERYISVGWSNTGYYTIQADDDKDFSSPITKNNKDKRIVSCNFHIDEDQDAVYYIRVINSNGKCSDVIKADLGGEAVEKETSSSAGDSTGSDSTENQTPSWSWGDLSGFPSFDWGSYFKK